MIEWFKHLINIERWDYAMSCVSQLYGIQVTFCPTHDSLRSDSVNYPTSEKD